MDITQFDILEFNEDKYKEDEYKKIQVDMEYLSCMMKDVNQYIKNQQEDIYNLEDHIINTEHRVLQSETILEEDINSVYYTVGGTAALTGIIGLTIGIKPALITGVITSSILVGRMVLSYIW